MGGFKKGERVNTLIAHTLRRGSKLNVGDEGTVIGPCNDAVVGPVHDGEVSISTASNSNAGRFGSKKASLYLGSPATVAASAVSGAIVDPRTFAVEPS